MYTVKPLGIDIKKSDRNVKDGFLQESINLQWRDDAFKPMPDRILYDVNVSGYSDVIFHKVGDENRINVFGVKSNVNEDSLFLAFDLADYLVGGSTEGTILEWFGTIVDGEFQSKTVTQVPMVITPGASFTILNGIIYFMGDGTTESERYYYKLQYNEEDNTYSAKDMYAWKDLIPYYPFQDDVTLKAPNKTYNVLSSCGIILFRFALVLKSGEVVLPSPIYASTLFGLNRSDTAISKDDIIDNIHSIISLDLDFPDDDLFDEEISSINIYATTPYYKTKLISDSAVTYSKQHVYYPDNDIASKKAEEPFYLINTVDKGSITKLLLYVDKLDTDIEFDFAASISIDINTVAASEVMPYDNFSYHRLYGKITSYNGRLIVERPITILSGGHTRSLASVDSESIQAFNITTEDGLRENILSSIDKAIENGGVYGSRSRGIISYPDFRAFSVGVYFEAGVIGVGFPATMFYSKSRKNSLHNLSCAFGFHFGETNIAIGALNLIVDPVDSAKLNVTLNYDCIFNYLGFLGGSITDLSLGIGKYSSENRIQLSAAGEFKVWPVENSYRIGEGKIMAVGNNSVDPGNADIIAPLIIGTSEGVYTINLDPSGNNLFSNITKTANLPYVSSETLQIEGFLLFVSDKGLMAIQNGEIINLTNNFFPEQGNGDYPVNETIFANYNVLTTPFFGGTGNPYLLDDIVRYMKGAILAYDGRRNNIWCSNPSYNFSLVYNMNSSLWNMSTLVFSRKIEFFSFVETVDGELYSRYMVVSKDGTKLYILSGEDLTTEVDFHLLTRAIKFSPVSPSENADRFKQIDKMIARCLLKRSSTSGYFSFGVWGKQDVNKFKKSLPVVAKSDSSTSVFPNNVRQDIPINNRKGKYKSIHILLCGKALPESEITGFDFEAMLVDNNRMR